LFATGMLNTGIRTEGDFTLNLLGEYTENKSVPLKTSTFMGLALAYAGSHREDLLGHLLPHVADDTVTMEISCLAALALGFIFVGRKHGEVSKLFCKPSWRSMSTAINRWMRSGKVFGFRIGIVVPW
jgi:26S proteasome regulatory subunit N1